MKKIVLCLLFSALIGALLGVYSFRLYNKDERVSSTYNSVYAIQIGVFDEVNNANKLASKYSNMESQDIINDLTSMKEVVLDINSRMGQSLELNKREKGSQEQER